MLRSGLYKVGIACDVTDPPDGWMLVSFWFSPADPHDSCLCLPCHCQCDPLRRVRCLTRCMSASHGHRKDIGYLLGLLSEMPTTPPEPSSSCEPASLVEIKNGGLSIGWLVLDL